MKTEIQGLTNFFLSARLWGRANFCSLLSKYHLQLSLLICSHQMFTQWGFCSLNVVLTSKIRCASKNNFHNSNTSIKSIHKNMLKACNVTKNKLCHRYFDNNLQKKFRTNIFEKGTGQILLIVVLMVNLWLKLQMEIVD